MKIAVISDTHLHEPRPWLEAVYDKHLAGADAVLHCGDMTGKPTWAFLNRHPAFHAVAGNMDDRSLKGGLESRLSLDLAGLRVGMTHGWGVIPFGLWKKVAESFGPGYDLICFGHTHTPKKDDYQGTLVLNPGSLREGSMALVHVLDNKKLEIEFVTLD
ncbi:MAG: metallophosphoesterase [Thermodesulfobacteriota bacterium]|nr:metallophosphoesterase [Thermodesulfobacteriota bacterium]